MLGKRDFEKAQVKNKAAATRQITAEQILREAVDSQTRERPIPKLNIADDTELGAYRMAKRKEFEDTLRRQRHHIGTWIKYAKWEEGQQEFRRARSIFERALQVEYQNVSLWLKYIEMEISHKYIQHARTLYDRVTSLLPRVDQFWYKYAYMEERLENYAGARAIYEKWMSWKPTDNAWLQYVKFEERCGEPSLARAVFERYLQEHQTAVAFTRYCKFEERHKEFDKARAGYETCIHLLDAELLNEEVFIKYAQFEIRRGETERASRVFKLGLERLGSPDKSKELYSAFVQHTKLTGKRSEIEQILIDKRRAHYERLVTEDSENFQDAFFNYIRMEEEAGEIDRAREMYERAVSRVPPGRDKKHWKRYVYLWLFYAQFEETVCQDMDRCRSVYETAVKLLDMKKVSFSKVSKAFAEFELRQMNLPGFRSVLLHAVETSKGVKRSVARYWVEMELKLGNVSQARQVAAKIVEINPCLVQSWIGFVELEKILGEPARALALCDVGWKSRESMDNISALVRKEIEIRVGMEGEEESVRKLFKRLLDVSDSGDFQVFLDFADFELNSAGSSERACAILEEGLETLPGNLRRERQILKTRLEEMVEMNEAPRDET